MRVLMLLACGSLLMHCGCSGPRSRGAGTTARDAFELQDRDRQLTQALAHYGRGLLLAGEEGSGSVDALRHFKAAWRNAPDQHDLGLRVASLSIAQADPATAIEILEQHLRWQPDRGALLHHVLAELYALDGDREASRGHLRRAIEQPDALPDSYLALAAGYADESPAEQANVLRAGSARFDESIRIHYALAYVLAGQALHGEAVDAFADVYARARDNPDQHAIYLNPAFYLHYGAVLEREARYDEAAAVFLEGLKQWPKAHRIMNYLAYMWAEQNTRLDDAMHHVERALEFEPDNGAYVDTRGWIRYRQGDYEGALTDIRRAHELLGDDPEILDHLGDVHAALGNSDKALTYWMRSYRLDPDNDALLLKLGAAAAMPPDDEQAQ